MKKTTTKILAVASVLIFAACGKPVPTVATKGVTDKKTATQAVSAVNTAMGKALSKATPARQTANARFRISCDSGSAEATLTATATGDQAGMATYNVTFDACKLGDETLSGSLTWAANISQTGGTIEMSGAIAYEGPTYAGNFSFNNFRVQYSVMGTGADTRVCVTTTGSYTIGGTSYEVDASVYGGVSC